MPGVSCSCRRVHTCMCAHTDADACTHTHTIRKWLSHQPGSRAGLHGPLPWASRFWEMKLMQQGSGWLLSFSPVWGEGSPWIRGGGSGPGRLAIHLLPSRSPGEQIPTGFDQMCTQLQHDQCWVGQRGYQRLGIIQRRLEGPSWLWWAWKMQLRTWGLLGTRGIPAFPGACLAFFLPKIYQFCNCHVSWQSLRDCEALGKTSE